MHLLLMALTTVVLVSVAMFGLSILTAHGKSQVVPDIKGLTVPAACELLASCGLKAEVIDSIYSADVPSGAVAEQLPVGGNKVKPGRTIYLTIKAYESRKVALPPLVGTSLRQAMSQLKNLGFRNISEVRVPSEYRDLVIGIKSMGVPLKTGSQVSLSSALVIEVGEGFINNEADTDSLATDEFEPTDEEIFTEE